MDVPLQLPETAYGKPLQVRAEASGLLTSEISWPPVSVEQQIDTAVSTDLGSNWHAATTGIAEVLGDQTASENNKRWVVNGAGAIHRTSYSASGRHFVYRPIEGDGELIVQIPSSGICGIMIVYDIAPYT